MEGKKKGNMKRKKGGGAAIMEDMDHILADPRFAHVSSDLRLRHVPKEERKVKLDSRFHSVLTDDKFYEKSTMDPRGRKGHYSTKEDLLKFYQLSSGEDSDSDEDEGRGSDSDEEVEDEELEKTVDRGGEQEKTVDRDGEQEKTVDRDGEQENDVKEDSRIESDKAVESAAVVSVAVRERVEDMSQDYARGEVLFSDDSSDDDSSTDDENDEDVGVFEWGELDQDAVWDNEKEVEETSRFAVCNLDWDRVKAADIMILFNSFCPRGGSVRRVTIFTSEYGKQRLAEEDTKGPQELRLMGKGDGDINLVDLEKLEKGKLDSSAGATKNDYEALRRYQRNRLRYYYAVVECDSTETARVIYQECDRQPYEGAGVHLDLRYIPSEMTFDETPHDVCHKVPESYEAKTFVTTALHDARPILTWDETDPERKKVLSSAMTRAMKGDQLDDECLKGLIASSSDEEGDDILMDNEGSDCDSDEDDATKASRIAKFRALISEIDEKERKKKERDIDLEETFNFGDNKEEEEESEEEEEEDVEDKESGKEKDKSTAILNPFDKYLEKRRSKRKERILRRKNNKAKENAESDESDVSDAMSDDELPEDARDLYNDPFFAEDMKKMNADKKKRKKKTDSKLSDSNGTETETQGNLELLLMKEDNEDRKHFSMREIIENSKEKKKKRRKTKLKKKKEETLQQKQQESATDDFKVNTSDPRFVGLMTSGDYNIDPSHSHFKRTRAMDTLIAEVQKKRVAESFEEVLDTKRNRPEDRSSLELSALVKKVKSKAKKPSIRQ